MGGLIPFLGYRFSEQKSDDLGLLITSWVAFSCFYQSGFRFETIYEVNSCCGARRRNTKVNSRKSFVPYSSALPFPFRINCNLSSLWQARLAEKGFSTKAIQTNVIIKVRWLIINQESIESINNKLTALTRVWVGPRVLSINLSTIKWRTNIMKQMTVCNKSVYILVLQMMPIRWF